MRLIVLDTESTARNGQICQLAYLTAEGDAVSGRNLYFSVDAMSPEAQAVHGMDIEMLNVLSAGERFGDRAGAILADLAAADLWIGHNIAADLHMLRLEMERLGLALPPVQTLCTMNRFTPVLKLKRLRGPGSPKPPRLSELCAHYGIADETVCECCETWFEGGASAHDARFDAASTYLCVVEALRRGDLQL